MGEAWVCLGAPRMPRAITPYGCRLLESGDSLSALWIARYPEAGSSANESLESLGALWTTSPTTEKPAAFQLTAVRRAAFLFAYLESLGAAAISNRKSRSVRSRFSEPSEANDDSCPVTLGRPSPPSNSSLLLSRQTALPPSLFGRLLVMYASIFLPNPLL